MNASTLVVEDNIPVPEDREIVGWPHKQLAVGQSFFVAGKSLSNVCNANQRYQKKLGWRFTARKVEGGVRVWRTA